MNLTERLAAAEAELAAIKKELEAEQVGSLLPTDEYWTHWMSMVVPNNKYKAAITTMLLLRQQPGSEAVKDEEYQWIVTPTKEGSVKSDYWDGILSKLSEISPCFRTKEHAEAAIKAVGADRIQKMFHTLHGVNE